MLVIFNTSWASVEQFTVSVAFKSNVPAKSVITTILLYPPLWISNAQTAFIHSILNTWFRHVCIFCLNNITVSPIVISFSVNSNWVFCLLLQTCTFNRISLYVNISCKNIAPSLLSKPHKLHSPCPQIIGNSFGAGWFSFILNSVCSRLGQQHAPIIFTALPFCSVLKRLSYPGKLIIIPCSFSVTFESPSLICSHQVLHPTCL